MDADIPPRNGVVMEKTREIVKAIVLEAGELVKGAIGKVTNVGYKGEIDLVTDVDRKSEEMISGALREAFPTDDLLAEEGGIRRAARSKRRWLIDPLDGTTNFVHGYPFLSITVALESADEILFGVVYDPLMNEYFEAEKGAGATLNGDPIHVSTRDDIDHCLFATGFPYDIREHPEGHLERLRRVLMAGRGIRRDGSAALDLCYVAAGRIDAYYENKLAPWDTAAGRLMVEEAGGRVTTFRGEPYSIYGGEILATNGRIHDGVIDILEGGTD